MMNMAVIVKPVDSEVPDDISKLPRLEGWTDHSTHLSGTVYNHPYVPDGEYVHTSPVTWLRRDVGLAQTKNTLYALVHENER